MYLKLIKVARSAFAEIQDSLSAELNYEIEAQNLEVFKTFHSKLDDKIIIPTVYKDYSSRRILTLSLEQGDSIETASSWPIEIETQLAVV